MALTKKSALLLILFLLLIYELELIKIVLNIYDNNYITVAVNIEWKEPIEIERGLS